MGLRNLDLKQIWSILILKYGLGDNIQLIFAAVKNYY